MVMPLDEVYLERWKGSGLFIFRQFCSFMIRIQFRKDFRNFAGLGNPVPDPGFTENGRR
jgi:hypothetical protein